MNVQAASPLTSTGEEEQSSKPIISELSSLSGGNSVYYIVKAIQLLSLLVGVIDQTEINYIKELFSRYEINSNTWKILGKIFLEDNLRRIAFSFVERGALSQVMVSKLFNIPDQTVSRKFEELEAFKFIYPCLKLPRYNHKPGPRVTIYQTPDATPDQINNACQTQRNIDSPNYLSAFKTTQTIIDDYPNITQQKETNYKFILQIVKKTGIHFAISDIADIVTTELQNKGIKVWR